MVIKEIVTDLEMTAGRISLISINKILKQNFGEEEKIIKETRFTLWLHLKL